MSDAPDPMEAMHAHDAKVTLADLQQEITKARGQLDTVQAQIAKERAAWETELAQLRLEKQRLLDLEPEDREPEHEADPHDEPETPPTHHASRPHVTSKRGRGRR